MDITFVSCFLYGENPKRSYVTYKDLFDRLVSTGIRIVLFLDKRSSWTFPTNVHVEHVLLEDTWVGQHIPNNVVLPAVTSPQDTLEYMKIQNTKPEWLARASNLNPWNTDWFAWIDFGLVHVFRHPETTLSRLHHVPRRHQTAGIWPKGTYDANDRVCWRFAGGFLMIHHSKAADFHRRVCDLLQRNLPRFAWEVNIWYKLEEEGWEFGWFAADHNDTILSI
jgi:hypothetical protein